MGMVQNIGAGTDASWSKTEPRQAHSGLPPLGIVRKLAPAKLLLDFRQVKSTLARPSQHPCLISHVS